MDLTALRLRIKSSVGRDGDTTIDDAITYALEKVQDEIISDIPFPELLALGEINLEADISTYDLPDNFDQMIQIWDSTTKITELQRITPIEYRTFIGDATSNGNPLYYDILGGGASGATYIKNLLLFPVPSSYTHGIIASFAALTGAAGSITAFTDYNTTVAGAVQVTDAAHGLQTGMKITISATTNYNGVFEVTVIDANNFYIMATYVAEVPAGLEAWTATGTVITDVNHGLANDDYIVISGTTNYDNSYNIIYMTANTFYIDETYVAEAGAYTKTWTKSAIIPYVYRQHIAYLSATATENILSYMYPQLFIEGASYYLYRDNIYRDNPEKIAFRRSEYEKAKNQVLNSIRQPDMVSRVLPKRILPSNQKQYRVQTSGYAS